MGRDAGGGGGGGAGADDVAEDGERASMLANGGGRNDIDGGEGGGNDGTNDDGDVENVQAVLIPVGTDDYKKRSAATVRRTVSKGPNSMPSSHQQQQSHSLFRSSVSGAAGKGPSASAAGALEHHESAQAKFIKYAALFLLVAQMVGLVLLMRYSRTNRDPNQPLYLASTAVFVMEVMKLIICFMVIAYQAGNLSQFLSELRLHVLQSPIEILKLCVPSLLYTVQNNLLYLALTNLDAATYQVCYQLKILTTALFSAVLLGRKFSRKKWLSLVILTIGVAIVQASGSGDQHSAGSKSDHHHVVQHDQEGSAAAEHAQHREALEKAAEAVAAATESNNRFIGLVAVLCAACTSGFSGVYFEKILKGSRTSLWIRNVQMGLPSTIIAYLTVFAKDAAAIRTQGFLGGYTSIVWTVVTVQAVGGLIVAVVVRYADNVLKVFATSFSIVVSCIISAFLFDFHPSIAFLVGASLVVTATVMYSSPDGGGQATKKRRSKAASKGSVLPMTSTSASASGNARK